MKITLTEVEVEAIGTVRRGHPGSYGEPPEPDTVELEHVFLGEEKRIDILHYLDDDTLDEIEERLLDEEAQKQAWWDEDGYDEAMERKLDMQREGDL